ncbi:hypothetical protein V8C42DRAFT_337658 [Trichoderma barbatum]
MASVPDPLSKQNPPPSPAAAGKETQNPARRLTPLPIPTEGNEIALAYTPRKRKAVFDSSLPQLTRKAAFEPTLPQLTKMPAKTTQTRGISFSSWSGLTEAATTTSQPPRLPKPTEKPKGITPKGTKIQNQIEHIRKIQDTRFETITAFSTAIDECLKTTQGKYSSAAATQIHKALENTGTPKALRARPPRNLEPNPLRRPNSPYPSSGATNNNQT